MDIKRYSVDKDGIAKEDKNGAFCLVVDVIDLEDLLKCYESEIKPEILIQLVKMFVKYTELIMEIIDENKVH